MKLESLPIRNIDIGITQIQSQLANLTVQLEDIKRGKEVQEELWFTRCRIDGHHKDNRSTLMNYITA